MRPVHRPRWHQFSLATLLVIMTLAAVLARPAWNELKRWEARGFGWDYWRLTDRQVRTEERQRAAVERGMQWLQANSDRGDWQTTGAAGQTQESDL